ncbi:MAG: anthranilate phosphoribosyltransferase, partial [Dinghuibacter sp.]|nr:anthranilate phosphoribosyltransferase [Dinghuibacter sp.]
MKKILNKLFEHKPLSREEARNVMLNLGKGMYNEAEIAAFVTVFLMRSITINEFTGFRDALLELCLPVQLSTRETIDIVGTGGDGKNTFNISTLACFIVAGAGFRVTKHGNYGVSSVSGSSDVLETLGYSFSAQTDKLNRELEEAGICFLHAPLFHPALKAVAGVRRNLGLRTFFNLLGPLVNPVRPKYQVVGVFNAETARYYTYLLQQGDTDFCIVHTLDGYDEISLTDDAKLVTRNGEKIMGPVALGKRTVQATDILGGTTVADAAKIFRNILSGNGTWAQNAVVLANAAV